MDKKLHFNELIKRHRYNCSSLAKELKLSKGTVSSWAKGRTSPSLETIQKISELLGESVETVVNALMACKKEEK